MAVAAPAATTAAAVRRSLVLELDSPSHALGPNVGMASPGAVNGHATDTGTGGARERGGETPLGGVARPPSAREAMVPIPGLLARALEDRESLQRLSSDEVLHVQQQLAELMAETVAALRRATPRPS